tara:strand:- start:12685 stop:13014 length:330 start_codon:yes stop_codon:yes gene_type:complete
MEKFLKIYVTAAGDTGGWRIVSVNNVLAVEQASATTVTVTYAGIAAADVLTITHDAITAGDTTMREWFTDSMVVALAQSWQKSQTEAIAPLPNDAAGTAPVTVTGMALA